MCLGSAPHLFPFFPPLPRVIAFRELKASVSHRYRPLGALPIPLLFFFPLPSFLLDFTLPLSSNGPQEYSLNPLNPLKPRQINCQPHRPPKHQPLRSHYLRYLWVKNATKCSISTPTATLRTDRDVYINSSSRPTFKCHLLRRLPLHDIFHTLSDTKHLPCCKTIHPYSTYPLPILDISKRHRPAAVKSAIWRKKRFRRPR